MNDQKPTLVSLFTGAGGLDIGLEQAGFNTIYANEIEPYACETLRANQKLQSLTAAQFGSWFEKQVTEQRCYRGTALPLISKLRDRLLAAIKEPVRYLRHAYIDELDVRNLDHERILQITKKNVGEIDLVAGGPPCQPFSRAGKRELIDCEKGQLFIDFVRIVAGIRPRFFLFENVKGLVLHKTDIVHIKCLSCSQMIMPEFARRRELKNLDRTNHYCANCNATTQGLVEWSQKKSGSLDIIENEFRHIGYKCQSRVLNAADFGAPQNRERLIIIGSRDGEDFTWPTLTHTALADIKNTPNLFGGVNRLSQWRSMNDVLFENGHWKYGNLNPDKAVLWVKNVVRPHDEPVTWQLDRPAPTVGAHQSAKLAIAPNGVSEEQLFRQQWHILGRRQGDTPPVFVEHEYLTDEELLCLQTLPKSWYLYGTRMQRAFQIGNAVPPVLASALGTVILNAIRNLNNNQGLLDEQRYAACI